MRIKILWLGLPVVFVAVCSFHRLSTNYLNFEDIKDGQAIQETDYVYDFQEIEVVPPGGEPLKTIEIYLVNQKTDARFRISAHFSFRNAPKELVRDSCIDVIHLHSKVYIVTRAHGGGSRGYYIHSIIEVIDNYAIEKGRYLSCGNAYIRNNQITFPSYESNCPEIFPDIGWNVWNYRRFDLSER